MDEQIVDRWRWIYTEKMDVRSSLCSLKLVETRALRSFTLLASGISGVLSFCGTNNRFISHEEIC